MHKCAPWRLPVYQEMPELKESANAGMDQGIPDDGVSSLKKKGFLNSERAISDQEIT
jgi:hypothetical protein